MRLMCLACRTVIESLVPGPEAGSCTTCRSDGIMIDAANTKELKLTEGEIITIVVWAAKWARSLGDKFPDMFKVVEGIGAEITRQTGIKDLPW